MLTEDYYSVSNAHMQINEMLLAEKTISELEKVILTFQMKANEQSSPCVVWCIINYAVLVELVTTFEFVDEILKRSHTNAIY